MDNLGMAKPVSETQAIVQAVVFGIIALLAVIGAVWTSLMATTGTLLVLLYRLLFPLATFFIVAAVTIYIRRSPCAPFRPKDIARPVFISITVLGSMLSTLHPLYAVIGVVSAGFSTWVGLSNGYWDRSLNKDLK